jgi:hypothetical protein
VIAIGAVIISGGTLAFPLMLTYIITGALRHTVEQLQQRRKDRFDFDEFDD